MQSATTSLRLIERIKHGDTEAFNFLFQRYDRRLAIHIHYKMSPQLRRYLEVDDVIQETYLRAFRDFEQFAYRSPGSFLHWLGSIADHVLADMARYRGRQKRHALEMVRLRSESNPRGPQPADSTTPSRLLAQREELQKLLHQLDRLPVLCREVLLLSRVEGLTTQEVSDRIGKSREATALLLHRAVKRLRQIQEDGVGEK